MSFTPSIEELRSLLVYRNQGSVNSAARALGIDQSAMSRRLQGFQSGEQRLLERSGKSLKFTDKGRAALPAIEELVRQYDQLLTHLRVQQMLPRVLVIGVGSFAAEFYLPHVLIEAGKKLTDCRIETKLTRGRQRILGTAEGTFDLAIVTHDPKEIEMLAARQGNESRLVIEKLASQSFCVIASKTTTFGKELQASAAERAIAVEKLASWQLVGLDSNSGIRRRIEWHLAGRLQFVPGADTGGWSAAKEFARKGLGVAVVPMATLDPADKKELVIRRLSDRFAIEDYLIHRDKPLRPEQQEMIAAFHQAAKEHQREVQQKWKDLL